VAATARLTLDTDRPVDAIAEDLVGQLDARLGG
jgi:hypothetical protein